jgi:hypothetical protein
MRQRIGILLGLAAALPWMNVAAAADGSVKETIQKIYDRQDAAEGRLDTKAIGADETTDFVQVGNDGKTQTREQEDQSGIQMMQIMKSYHARTQIVSFSQQGSKVTVVVRVHIESVIRPPQLGRDSQIVFDATGRDEWVKRGGTWLCSRSHTLSEKGTVDGKAH